MHTEMLGSYQVELSARQIIDHGGWAAYATIHEVPADDAQRGADGAGASLFPTQRLADDTVFESEEAAIAGARRVALAFLGAGNTHA